VKLPSLPEQFTSEEPLGVAPEVVEKAVIRATSKLIAEIERVKSLIVEIRRALEARRDIFTIREAGKPENLCYAAVDSSFTAPAIELVGGYLGIVVVASVLYGSKCGRNTVDAKAYTELWFNNDLTSTIARYYERVVALKLLEEKKRGDADFDVLLLDGEIVPRTLGRREGSSRELLERVVELTSRMLELADKTDTAVVGVLKRSYARDIVNILGFHDIKLSDRAVMSLVLKPGEYLIAGIHSEIYSELRKLESKPGVKKEWLESRLKWYEALVSNIPVGYAVKLAFYRAPRTLYPIATKIEYLSSGGLAEDALISSLVHVSTGTGIPAPVDYADALSTITRELRQTAYQKLLAEIAKRAGLRARDILPLLSLMNPEKLTRILG
jgi:hypothetical protein